MTGMLTAATAAGPLEAPHVLVVGNWFAEGNPPAATVAWSERTYVCKREG